MAYVVVRLEIDPEFDAFGERLTGSRKVTVANRVVKDQMAAATDVMRKRMSEMLRPGHKYRIGASGAASENILTQPGQVTGKGRVTQEIITGNATPANDIIRKGLQPGAWPPDGIIRRWVVQKGLSGKFLGGDDTTKMVSGYRTKKGKVVRPYARRLHAGKRVESNLRSLQFSIWKGGSFRPSANWMRGAWPASAGKGRFEYAKWAVQQKTYYERVLATAEETLALYAAWLLDGEEVGKHTMARR